MKKMNSSFQHSAALLAAAGLIFHPTAAQSGILAYEGFDYPIGSALGGLDGGIGWAAPWTVPNPAGGSLTLTAGSLVADANAPAGYDSRSTGQSVNLASNYRGGRSLNTLPGGSFEAAGYLDGNGMIGADGKTLYLSFMQQPNGTGLFYEFELHRGDLGDPGRIGGIGNDQGGDNVNLRAPNNIHTPIGAGSTGVNFYIVRIDFKEGNDDIRVYQNPTSTTEPAEATLTLLAQSDLSFNGVSLGAFLNSRQVAHDEIRIGETWADMVSAVVSPPVAPAIALQPWPVTSYAGGRVVLTTVVTGSPAPALQWFRGNTPLDGETQPVLVLDDIQSGAAGQYKLTAVNGSGTAVSELTAVNVLPLPDGLVAYEGFDYPNGNGNLAGQDGGLGWASPWQQINNGSHDILSGSLIAGAMGPPGIDSNSLGGQAFLPNARRDGRSLDTSLDGPFAARGLLDANGRIGADGRTLYVSFLQQPNGTSLFYEMEFHRDNLGDPGRMAGVGNDQPGDSVHFRAPNNVHSLIGPGSTEVNFYVVRIDFKEGNDDIRVYQNPTAGTEPETPTLTLLDQADMSFNGLAMGAFANGRTVAHDEIRLGETWFSVVASPYSRWLAGFTFPAGADKSLTGDPEADQLSNLLEYAFGTTPVLSSTGPIRHAAGTVTDHGTPVLEGDSASGFRAVFGRRKDFLAAGLSYTVQFSADLVAWKNNTATEMVLASDAEIEAISVPWPLTVPVPGGTAPPRYFRVQVTAH